MTKQGVPFARPIRRTRLSLQFGLTGAGERVYGRAIEAQMAALAYWLGALAKQSVFAVCLLTVATDSES